MEKPKFVYVTYIRTTPIKLWRALTKPEIVRQYWGGNVNLSDWKKGSPWKHVGEDGEEAGCCVGGKVVESLPPKRLVLTWVAEADVSRVSFEIEPTGKMVRLTVIHGSFKKGSTMAGKVSHGWPLVLSSMKSYLETGKAIDILTLK